MFLLCIAIQLAYALYPFAQIFQLSCTKPRLKERKPVSVMICAKNEAANLEQNLPAILAQRYSNDAGKHMYEVIVVNDASTDDTENVLSELQQQYDHLRPVNVTNQEIRDLPGKKFALSRAATQAQHEFLLMTDADCLPTSEYWLENMVAPLHEGKQIAAGVGKYIPGETLLKAFVRWETLHTFLQYSTYTLVGKPYMAVGRNIAYTKSALRTAQNSAAWGELPSGDDDLLMRAVANSENTAIVCAPEAFTVSPAKRTWREWIHQKQRHMSTGKYYRGDVKALLGLYGLTHTLCWLLFIVLLFIYNWQTVVLVMSCRSLVYGLLWQTTAEKMQEKGLIKYFILFDFGWMVYNFAFAPYIIWKNKRQWK